MPAPVSRSLILLGRLLTSSLPAQEASSGRDARPILAAKAFADSGAGLPVAELRAWTVVANVVLNLDETITKG